MALKKKPDTASKTKHAKQFAEEQLELTGLPKTKRVNFNVSPELHKKLKLHATNKGLSMSELVTELIEKHIP